MLNKLKRIDWIIVGILLCFSVISPMLVHSATYGDSQFNGVVPKTIIFFAAGFVVLLLISIFDYRLILKWWMIPFGITTAMLIAIPFVGATKNGAQGWFSLGEFSFQPAEVAKITLIFALAQLIGRRDGDPLTFTRDLIPVGLITLIPFALVISQPDLGNAIIYLFILVGMLWIGGMKYRHMLLSGAIIAGCIALVFTMFTVFNDQTKAFFEDTIKQPHWYERINTFINPEEASSDATHQSRYAMIAIGSGGLTGDGYMQGELKRRSFIPYTYSDAIFVVIGEEFGFQGGSILLLMYFLLIYRMILIAFQCYDKRGAFVIIGIVSMFVYQIFQNIGMWIGLMPVTGINLPFISYGGTSLLLNFICIGIVMSIKIYQEKYQLDN